MAGLLARSLPGKEPTDSCQMDLEQTCRLRISLVAPGDRLLNPRLLSILKLRAVSADASLLSCGIQPDLNPFFQHSPLELRECPHHQHHHSARRCRRVDGFGQTAEARPGMCMNQ